MKPSELTEKVVDDICMMYSKGMFQREIARQIGCSQTAVSKAIRNRKDGIKVSPKNSGGAFTVDELEKELKDVYKELFIANAKVDFLLNSVHHRADREAIEAVRNCNRMSLDEEYKVWKAADEFTFSRQLKTVTSHHKSSGLM